MIAAAPQRAAAQAAAAPSDRAFIDVGVGAQPQRRTLSASNSFSLYDETATVAAIQRIRNGALLEIGGGVRLMPHLQVGAAFSTFGRPGGGSLTASIPDPIFYNRPSTFSSEANDLAHSERSIHLRAIWNLPVTPKLDVALSAGPSFLHVSQELATASVPSGSQSVTVARARQSGTAKGFNAGIQANYLFAPHYGVGLFGGYAGGSLDLPGASGVTVGGVRTGLALQARF
jgi:hypothetical protein